LLKRKKLENKKQAKKMKDCGIFLASFYPPLQLSNDFFFFLL
jgi:hypothetical protein